uniref:Pyridoxal phosphate-dependent aminotransferase n=1 Tax=candidate division CPR3 bacterium TaxID=2268181 RepID=A0A7V3J9D3_UNCC3
MIKDNKLVQAKIIERIEESASFAVLGKAKELEKQGEKVIHLEIGEPDFNPPESSINALIESLRRGETHYTTAQGIIELRKAIAEYERNFRKIKVEPEQIVITPGAKPMILFALLAAVNPGEKVLYPDPGYLSYKSLISFIGAIPVPYKLDKSRNFAIDFDDLRSKIDRKTTCIIINTPSNPTGMIHTPEELKEIVKIATENNLLIISDEVYSRIYFDGEEHNSILNYADSHHNIILIDAFSKTYAMTGFRLGYGVLPKELVGAVVKLIQNSFSCVPEFIQRAGIVALKEGEEFISRMVNEFQKRRDKIYSILKDVEGIHISKPKGAFYFFPEIKVNIDSAEFAKYLLENYKVALLPGDAFGENGKNHVRISFANSLENLIEASNRIADGLEKLRKERGLRA